MDHGIEATDVLFFWKVRLIAAVLGRGAALGDFDESSDTLLIPRRAVGAGEQEDTNRIERVRALGLLVESLGARSTWWSSKREQRKG